MIRIGLIQFPGSNCERETALAVKRAGMEPVEFLWNEPLDKLAALDGYIIVGGFSYEDRSRAGIIAALDPVIEELKIQSDYGKPVLGICNGAQILLEAGLVPGFKENTLPIALSENKRILDNKIVGRGFYNAWTHIRLSSQHQHNAFTRHLSTKELIHLPIAHAEGRFLMPDSLLKKLEQDGLNLFQYCDKEGQVLNYFPINPNGSSGNLAAISNKAGNVMAMMPHPERTTNGDPIFTSMREYIIETQTLQTKEVLKQDTKPLVHHPVSKTLPVKTQPKPGSFLCLVKLIITDNQALTVQNTLRRLGFPVTVHRFDYWEIESDSLEQVTQLKKTGLLYSDRKEREVSLDELNSEHTLSYLLCAKEDLHGQQTLQTLKTHYTIPHINQIHHGVLWQFRSETPPIAELINPILLTHIIGNPYAHECYQYTLS